MEAKEITIDLVREKLGNKGQNLTDQQINDILNLLRFICNKVIDGVIEEKAYYEN